MVNLLECPACGVENTQDSNFCRNCGRRLQDLSVGETTASYAAADRAELELSPDEVGLSHETPVLVVRSGRDREGEMIALGIDVVTIGRSPHSSDIFLDDVTVSRHHARVIRDEAGFLIEDLNSLNGTYVNRKRIERHRLVDGDELQIGKYKLAFVEPRSDEWLG